MAKLVVCLVVLCSAWSVTAQQATGDVGERRVALTETAVARDANGASALEATLKTTALNGAPDSPVTSIQMIIRNTSALSYAFVSGLVTFYDAAGVRCGEGIFKADALAVNESFVTDAPGLRIRCEAVSWRIVATNLLPRVIPNPSLIGRSASNLFISIDGEVHPIQLDKPMTITLGERKRTIMVRTAP